MAPAKPPAATAASELPTTFKYGMPVYGLVWPEGDVFYVCGGGGHGIKNRLVFAEAKGNRLTDQIGDFHFGEDCPNRLVLTPSGKSLICAMSKGGIKRLELDTKGKVPKVTEVSGSLQERLAETRKLSVNCIAFHSSGEYIALGCEDGSLMVYEWPGMRVKMDLSGDKKLRKAVTDVDFQHHALGGGSRVAALVVAVVLDGGVCELWDCDKAKQLCQAELARGQFKSDKIYQLSAGPRLVLQHLPKGMEGAQFKRVRFSRDGSNKLFALMNNRDGAYVTTWVQSQGQGHDNDGMLALSSSIKAASAAAPCMDVSADGSKLALATAEGEVVVLSCVPKFSILRRRPKAHMVFSTSIAFSGDGTRVLSASGDASVTVTDATEAPRAAIDWKRIYMLVLIAVCLVAVCINQWVKVLRASRGMTNQQAWVHVLNKLGLSGLLGAGKDKL